ncbi:hypothetical protein HYFRA_00014105 [Hymenoscyphus fraxineus]|uniref:Uncharacterized protein n=1 Tax=Hymenoscyphus fraxineus TaxID=746836 RepID=A0A9N9LD09_9HELO|nr:hypothetical protein HYFRA_00014105 [Hymenoscyphus fraxineus]
MATYQEQRDRKVHLSVNLRTSSPHTLPIHDSSPAEPLKLIATIKQNASPFPERPVTILTNYSCLDTTKSDDAFRIRTMKSPQITVPDSECPTPEIRMQARSTITFTRVGGDPDLLKRGDYYPFTFVTIPPLGQGHAEIFWNLTPERLMQRLGEAGEAVEDKMRRLLRPGDSYKIEPSDLNVRWWSFGTLEDEAGIKKKVARWALPDDLSLDRKEGEDETEEVAHKLVDLVDRHDVNHLSSRSAVEGEQIPDIKTMRAEGWIFGEPESGLSLMYEDDEGAVFTVTE